jgi:hypothetical protein
MPKPKLQKAVIYCRVSGTKQVREGDGLGSQETRCREFAGHKGYWVFGAPLGYKFETKSGHGKVLVRDERAVKPVAIGRKNWMFAGSEGGGKAMAIAFTLIETAKLNNVDPQAWLTWVLAQIADHKITRIGAFLRWRYDA